MVLPFFSRVVASAIVVTALVAPAHAQAISDREGYGSLLSCAAYFSAAAAITEGDRRASKDAMDLATSFMMGAMILAPGGNTRRTEAEVGKQAEAFAVTLMDTSRAMVREMDEMADNCGTLGEVYLPGILARAE